MISTSYKVLQDLRNYAQINLEISCEERMGVQSYYISDGTKEWRQS